jgi:hypothetical protein
MYNRAQGIYSILPIAFVIISAFFTISGYSITPGYILVHRLFWVTRLPLSDLQSAQFEPAAMQRSIRTFGNGGLFSITGFFRNSLLGKYRAFVTDQNLTVVLRFSERTVVISPAEPEEFVNELKFTCHAV